MKKLMIYLMLMVVCLATTVNALRVDPKPVTPVIKDGIEYSAPLELNLMGYVVAKNIKTNSVIWKRQIYEIKYESELEGDVQWCFINNLKLEGNQLIITNEKDSVFSLDIETLEIKTIKGSNVIDHTKYKHPSERN